MHTQTTTPKRIVDIESGIVMVVTDLHGDWALYQRYRDVFLALHARGQADTLLFTGDLIHNEGPADSDHSLDIVLDLLALQDELGPNLVVLLGNHEMPHIYPFVLSKGDYEYTPRFERALGQHRDAVVDFFTTRPLYARTAAGVVLCHAGAFPHAHNDATFQALLGYSHRALLEHARQRLPDDLTTILPRLQEVMEEDYTALVQSYFAVTGLEDPRYYDYLISQFAMANPLFDMLWDALFTCNERQFSHRVYTRQVQVMLQQLSTKHSPQRVLVSGHLSCRDGYTIVAEGQQLRIASGNHAKPDTSARYLRFDAGKAIPNAEALLTGLGTIFSSKNSGATQVTYH